MKTVLNVTKLRFPALALSAVLIIAGFTLTHTRGGFNLGIDFQAGLSQQLEIETQQTPSADDVRAVLAGIDGVQVQEVSLNDRPAFTVRVRDDGTISNFSEVMGARVVELIEGQFGAGSVIEVERSFVGPRFSADLTRNAFLLVGFAMGLILLYVWFRFKLGYAVSAIAAVVHDVAFMLAFIGAAQLEVSTATIAAVLTIIGYSLNDTIVIFDRVRENEDLLRDSNFANTLNVSISQSLSRTLITSITTLLAVSAIYFFAVGAIQDFALNLMVGVLVGTYSSLFVASPALLGWQNKVQPRRDRKKQAKGVSVGPKTAAVGKPVVSGLSVSPGVDDNGSSTAEVASPHSESDVEAMKRELAARKRQAAAGAKHVSRAKRKGKK
ncbi:MAG: protein translocase subunit SecF [Spirochaetaceae bacterium]|nr:MAG: protein translocase subunit SecF [Spirochaetaceae bacterium]